MEPTAYMEKSGNHIEEPSKTQGQNLVFDEIFKLLNDFEIQYCLLREYKKPTFTKGTIEIDLLVNPKHLTTLSRTLIKTGFVETPRWGHDPHYFFINYNKINGYWIKLDVVTQLRYGKPIRRFLINLATDCLQNRRGERPFVLSSEHEFITLFLHCLLDKEQFRMDHRLRLAFLQKEAVRNSSVKQHILEYINRYLAPQINWETISNAIEKDTWETLLNYRKSILHQLFWREPIKSTYRNISSHIIRKLRPLLFLLHRRGLSVVLLAPDGAGKSTLAKELTRQNHFRARLIYMGSNLDSSTVGLPTSRWIKEKVKSRKEATFSLLNIILRGLNFSNRLLEQWYRLTVGLYHLCLGRFVIYDRYVYDSYLAPRPSTSWKRLRRWLLGKSSPPPNLIILLDAPGTILYQRKGEHTSERLERQRQIFLGLKNKIPNMIIVDATRGAKEVYHEVVSLIWETYGKKLYEKEISINDSQTID